MVGLLAGAWELTSLLQVGNTLELVRQKPCDGKANARYRPGWSYCHTTAAGWDTPDLHA
jgi:hypothetical protein